MGKRYLIFVVLVIALLFRMLFLTMIEAPFFDEKLYVPAAYNYVERGFPGPVPWYHPYLRSILLFSSMSLLGDNPLGWRLPWVIIGVLSVYFLYLLTFRLFASREIALIAAFLLAIDPVHITHSRITPDETVVLFAFVAALYFTLRYVEEMKPYQLLIAGLMIGISLSIKWFAVFTIALTLFITLASLCRKDGYAADKAVRFSFIVAALIVLPATVYLFSYYPWSGRGYSIEDLIWLHKDMYLTQQSLKASDFKDMYQLGPSMASGWFMFPPIKGFKFTLQGGIVVLLYLANPFVWPLTLPSFCYVIYRYITERSFSLLVLIMAFILQYAPLLLIKRPLYLHAALSVLPVAFIINAYTLWHFMGRGKRGWILISFVVVNFIFVTATLPLIINYPIQQDSYNRFFRWWLDPMLIF